jgi:MinD-like ATPase involved in chromosome partitioning or flagellar assembly
VVWSKSEREQALEDVDSRLNRLGAKGVRNGHVIAVGSAKGGTGKDALAVTLGDTIATALRGAPTLVLDGDWDFGTLGKRAPEEGRSPGTILDVYEHRHELVSPAQLGGFVARMSSGCHLLSAPRDPEAMERLQVEHYAEVVTALHRFYSVIFVTMAPGVMAPICRWAFAAADRIVFVTDTRLVTADQTLRALAFLRNRHPDTPLHLAINQVPARPSQPQQRMIDVQANNHMSTSVVQVPWDERLEQQLDSGTFTLEDPELSAGTKLALKRAALAIAEGLVCEEER